jgi:sec-independent protein translocase protein TatA
MHSLLFLEFIGTSELMVVLLVALIVFGPRKLPQMGRSLGQALHQLKNASNDFKSVWETEALLETAGTAALTPAATTERAATEQAHAELVPGDGTTKALLVGEGNASPQEALVPIGASYNSAEAALVEG